MDENIDIPENQEVATNTTDYVQLAMVAVTGAVVGAVIGYFIGKRHGDVFVVPAETLDEDPEDGDTLEDMDPPRKHVMVIDEVAYNTVVAVPDPELEGLLAEEDEVLSRQLNHEEPDEPVRYNVFAREDDTWNYEEELLNRTREAPYIIHYDEYAEGENEYKQETVTYYAGDNIMADPLETPIYNHHGLMGELKFGHGSADPNVVYIRNDAIRMEWEVLLHTGRFEYEVLGMQMETEETELRHSSGPQRFRSWDN